MTAQYGGPPQGLPPQGPRSYPGPQRTQPPLTAPLPSMGSNGQAVRPVQLASDAQHADKAYGKGARRGGAWRVLFFVALLVLIGALSAIGYILYTYWDGEQQYEELKSYMVVDDPDDYLTLASFTVDWEGLRAINPDVVGWVYIPGTEVNYPIVWKEGDDEYYLYHNFGDNSVGDFGAEYGAISLSSANSPTWTDQLNFVSGHHMRNGTMFALIGEMTDSAVFNDHRTIFVLTPEGNFKTTSFACTVVPGKAQNVLIPNFPSEEEFHAYLEEQVADSYVTPDPPGPPVGQVKQAFVFYSCVYGFFVSGSTNNRTLVYCNVDEYLPAGSDVSQGTSLIDEGKIESVEGAVSERAL